MRSPFLSLPPGGRWPRKARSDEEWRAVQVCNIVPIDRLSPAFLISQKSEIFDSFPPGEAFYTFRKTTAVRLGI